jgi:hypothetical protein
MKLSSREGKPLGFHSFIFLFGLLFWTTTLASASIVNDEECSSAAHDDRAGKSSTPPEPGSLRPFDLAGPVLFENFVDSHVVDLPGILNERRTVNRGTVEQINPSQTSDENKKSTRSQVPASVLTVQEALDKETVQKIRHILEQNEDYDRDPDSVDGMPTFEIFIDRFQEIVEDNENNDLSKNLDLDPTSSQRRSMLRTQFRNLTQQYVEQILTPLVRQEYPNVCQSSPDRLCMPCHSLVRRYRHGERQSHATHLDAQALVTVVVSLSEYDRDYRGGLYVSTGLGQKQFLKLNEGDAAIHQSNLFHGVKVFPVDANKPEDTHRWSWIIWYKDSSSGDCLEDFSHEWFVGCANAGDAVCQYLHSTKDIPDRDARQETQRILTLTQAAALGGVGEAAVKMAGGYLHILPSPLPYNQSLAREYYRRGIQSHHPEAHYGLANQILMNMENGAKMTPNTEAKLMRSVLYHLESAARLGHSFSMFNLGVVHAFGYCGIEPATKISQEWFIESVLPEGLYIASRQAKALGDHDHNEKQDELLQHARNLGWGTSWRKKTREQTSTSGLSLNLPWPNSPMGSKPPQF